MSARLLPFLRRFWPWLPLALAQLTTVGLALRQGPAPITPLSGGIALAMLTVLVAPVIQPNPATRLSALLGVLFAGLHLFAAGAEGAPAITAAPMVYSLPLYLIARLANGLFIFPVSLHFAARFPPRGPAAGRYLPGWPTLRAIYLWTAAHFLAFLLLPQSPWRLIVLATAVGSAILIAAWATWLLLMVSRDPDPAYRRSAQQARLILLGFWAAQLPLALRLILLALGLGLLPLNLVLVFQGILPAVIIYAIFRHDLFEIDRAVRRALAYGAISSILLAAYFGFTMALTFLLSQQAQFRGLAVLATLLVAAALFQPLYRRSQAVMDRLVYPERRALQTAVAQAQKQLGRVNGQEGIIQLLDHDLPAQFGATWGQLILAPAPDTAHDLAAPPAWNAPLVAGDRVIGRYWLGPRRSGVDYSGEERAELRRLMNQAALALAYAGTLDQLNQLNRALEAEVTARAAQVVAQQQALAVVAERQRLARDLHDSVTQTLFSLNLEARALRKLARRDVEAAIAGLHEQEKSARQALAEMRALLEQLRTPLAGERPAQEDLAAAVRAYCADLAAPAGLVVTLDAPDSLLLPAPVARELLFVTREALHNVVKHGQTGQARCRLRWEANTLQLMVQDNGPGFVPGAAGGEGLGLRNMRRRMSDLGGVIQIQSAPGQGTTVQAMLPLEGIE